MIGFSAAGRALVRLPDGAGAISGDGLRGSPGSRQQIKNNKIGWKGKQGDLSDDPPGGKRELRKARLTR